MPNNYSNQVESNFLPCLPTLGPALQSAADLHKIKDMGVQRVRQNCSHSTIDWHLETAALVKAAGLDLLIDLPGPKVRLENVETQVLEIGQIIVLGPDGMNVNADLKDIPVGQNIKINDGIVKVEVTENNEGNLTCKVTRSGTISDHKGLNFYGISLPIENLTAKDKAVIDTILPAVEVDWLAISFVQNASDILKVKEYIHSKGFKIPKICAKIETEEAIKNLDSIAKVVDSLMVARGDLAMENFKGECGVPFLQEKIAKSAKAHNLELIVATEALASMLVNPVPTRAEVSDIFRSLVLNQANFAMLSNESSVGKYPIECIKVIKRVYEIYLENQTNEMEEAGELKELED
jgi:pyruvate kinase